MALSDFEANIFDASPQKCSHQLLTGRNLPFGTTTAFGPYVNFFFEFMHYAIGGVVRACALHFDCGVEQACSAATMVTSSHALRGLPLRLRPAVLCYFPLRGVIPLRGAPLADPRFCGSACPSSVSTSSLSRSSMRVQYQVGGGRTCFPDRDFGRLRQSHCILHRSCHLHPRGLFQPGWLDVFSRPRLRTSS